MESKRDRVSNNTNKIVSQALGPQPGCPGLDQLVESLSVPNSETQAHLASCPHCTTELALFQQFQEESPAPREKADVDAIVARLRKNSPVVRVSWWKPFFSTLWRTQGLVPASLVLAAIVVGLFVWSPGRSGSNQGPLVSGEGDVVRSAKVAVVGPSGSVRMRPEKLEWLAVKGAVSYKVSMSEVDGTPTWSATVENAGAALPGDVLVKVVSHKAFNWQVQALDSHGAVIADSGRQQFRVQ
jgi:hypothetical protein